MNTRDPPAKPIRRNHHVAASQLSDNDEMGGASDEESSPVKRRFRQKELENDRTKSPPSQSVQRPIRNYNEVNTTLPSKSVSKTSPSNSILNMEPETTIGKAVKLRGELSFESLLRIDGEFEGTLISKGSLIIGPKGVLKGDVNNMNHVFVDGGKIYGMINVEKLFVRSKGEIYGNITSKSITVDPECIIVGQVNINPYSSKENEIEVEKKVLHEKDELDTEKELEKVRQNLSDVEQPKQEVTSN